jgi:hypothetical protein
MLASGSAGPQLKQKLSVVVDYLQSAAFYNLKNHSGELV